MSKSKKAIVRIARSAIIAAIYFVLCFFLQPLSYGAVQFRIGEMLTILPVFTPDAILGLTIGCFLANMLSFSPLDMLFGTLATLAAAVCTHLLRNVRFKGWYIASSLPPVIFNAVIIGAEITYFFMPESAGAATFAYNMLTVGLGQLVCCVLLGLQLARIIDKNKTLRLYLSDDLLNKE